MKRERKIKQKKMERNTKGTGCTITQMPPHRAKVQQNPSTGNQKQPKSNTSPETTYQRHNRGRARDELNHHPT